MTLKRSPSDTDFKSKPDIERIQNQDIKIILLHAHRQITAEQKQLNSDRMHYERSVKNSTNVDQS